MQENIILGCIQLLKKKILGQLPKLEWVLGVGRSNVPILIFFHSDACIVVR